MMIKYLQEILTGGSIKRSQLVNFFIEQMGSKHARDINGDTLLSLKRNTEIQFCQKVLTTLSPRCSCAG